MSFSPDLKLTSLTLPAPINQLYQLDLTEVVPRWEPDGVGFIVYFCPHTTDYYGANHPTIDYPERSFQVRKLRLEGNVYEPVPVNASGFQKGTKGAPPQPTIDVSNTTRFFGDYLIKYGDLVGAKVTRIIISDLQCDQPDEENPGSWINGDIGNAWSVDTFIVEEKASQSPEWIQWRLKSALDVTGRKSPNRQMFRDSCRLRYPVYDPTAGDFFYDRATCPWLAGIKGRFYDRNDVPVLSPDEDGCSRKLSGCKIRFGGDGDPLPIDAFPGLGTQL